MKMQFDSDSVTMVNIIVPVVMSFLTDVNNSNCVIDDLIEEESEEDEDDDDHDSWSDEDEDNFDAVNDDQENNYNGNQVSGQNSNEIKRWKIE